jgi:hypothetical protein
MYARTSIAALQDLQVAAVDLFAADVRRWSEGSFPPHRHSTAADSLTGGDRTRRHILLDITDLADTKDWAPIC